MARSKYLRELIEYLNTIIENGDEIQEVKVFSKRRDGRHVVKDFQMAVILEGKVGVIYDN